MMNPKKIELLSPAGSFDVMKAVFSAGADAVYMGLNRFSARAFADNADTEQYLEAIHYAHLHGKKLYLTVNTLLRDRELYGELYELMLPLYRAGLDAAIVQDPGVISFLKRHFPSLPLHASTQMTVTDPYSARMLYDYGFRRLVPARELSLPEIRRIREASDAEIECFIHGALCYSYSGQCLMSSLIGGRSGNRGRCAQPCRLEYDLFDPDGKQLNRKQEKYLLSLKDLCAIDLLPELLESGVCSLKIEGRMKKAEYAAGVTSVYRKYLDLYESQGREGYRVEEADKEKLFRLFNRKGFTDAYFTRQNGRDMLTLTAADFRTEDEALTEAIRENYIRREHKTPVSLDYCFRKARECSLSLTAKLNGQTYTVQVKGGIPAEARQRESSREEIGKQLKKLGNTPFEASEVKGERDPGLFIPVSMLNELRRSAADSLSRQILSSFERHDAKPFTQPAEREKAAPTDKKRYAAAVQSSGQFEAALRTAYIERIDLKDTAAEPASYTEYVSQAHAAGKRIFLELPRIFRDRAVRYLDAHLDEIRNAAFDGYILHALGEAAYIREKELSGEIIADQNLYDFNREARTFYAAFGLTKLTLSEELNHAALLDIARPEDEFMIYGRQEMMVSAGCLLNTAAGCRKRSMLLWLQDREGHRLPVKNDCRYCLNTIYNAYPLSLADEAARLSKLPSEVLKLRFTTEDGRETEEVLRRFDPGMNRDADMQKLQSEYTKGHFRRGAE